MRYLFVVFFLISSVVFADQQYKTHKVSRGETVESIAKEYGIPAVEIYKLNPDARKGISVSTTLIIPPKALISQQEPEGSFKIHKVKRKETLYSLSKEYNISIEEIKRYNKFLYAEPLKKGTKLRIPDRPKLSETTPAITQEEPASEDKFREHVVLPKETKYGISKKYGISIAELEAMNPWMDSLQPGMMLKIRTKDVQPQEKLEEGFILYEVSPKETIYSLTREYEISRDSLISLNPELKDGLKIGMRLKLPKKQGIETVSYFSETENLEERIENLETKNLVLMLPFNLDAIQMDSTGMAAQRIKKDPVLQISLDFYSGVLMALDSAKAQGISTNLKVFDTKQNASEVRNLLYANNFQNTDAVIGPLLQDVVEAVAESLEKDSIPVISPLSTKAVRNSSNFVQTRPSREMMEMLMLEYLSQNSANKNVIIIAGNDFFEIKNKLMAAVPGAKLANPASGGVIDRKDLTDAMSSTKENWIVLESNNIGLVSSLTSMLNAMRDSYQITLFTTDKGKIYDNESISNTHLGNLNFTFPSVDKEFDLLKNRNFIKAYEEQYGLYPSQYAVRGFDITYDILLRLAAYGSVFDSFKKFEATTEYAENKFDYQRKADGGYLNNALYIIRYDKNLNRNVVR